MIIERFLFTTLILITGFILIIPFFIPNKLLIFISIVAQFISFIALIHIIIKKSNKNPYIVFLKGNLLFDISMSIIIFGIYLIMGSTAVIFSLLYILFINLVSLVDTIFIKTQKSPKIIIEKLISLLKRSKSMFDYTPLNRENLNDPDYIKNKRILIYTLVGFIFGLIINDVLGKTFWNINNEFISAIALILFIITSSLPAAIAESLGLLSTISFISGIIWGIVGFLLGLLNQSRENTYLKVIALVGTILTIITMILFAKINLP